MDVYSEELNTVLQHMMARVHIINEANGWTDSARTFGDEIALLHSEVSEALEEWRDNGLRSYFVAEDGLKHQILHSDYEGHKPLGVPSEAADILIRLLDFCRRYDIDLAAEFEAKLAYNATRGYRHGGKRL